VCVETSGSKFEIDLIKTNEFRTNEVPLYRENVRLVVTDTHFNCILKVRGFSKPVSRRHRLLHSVKLIDVLLCSRWYSVMYKKFSNRLSGGMADSWHGTPFRHHDAVEFHRARGENRASSMQSEKSRKSH
ncbi:unnamed protein product, partial [Heterotrigona itama]